VDRSVATMRLNVLMESWEQCCLRTPRSTALKLVHPYHHQPESADCGLHLYGISDFYSKSTVELGTVLALGWPAGTLLGPITECLVCS
jgi:hypothetical protein